MALGAQIRRVGNRDRQRRGPDDGHWDYRRPGRWVLSVRFVKGLLHDVHPTDAFSIVMPIGCLLLTAFFAAVPAARRASQLDPVEALRSECDTHTTAANETVGGRRSPT